MMENDPPHGFAPARFSPGFLDRAGPYFRNGPIVGLRVLEGHGNYIGVAHGGVLTTFADVALSWQVHASADPPLAVATISLTTNFLSAARVGDWLTAHARIDRIGKRTAYASGEIRKGDTAIMTMTGVFAILEPR